MFENNTCACAHFFLYRLPSPIVSKLPHPYSLDGLKNLIISVPNLNDLVFRFGNPALLYALECSLQLLLELDNSRMEIFKSLVFFFKYTFRLVIVLF